MQGEKGTVIGEKSMKNEEYKKTADKDIQGIEGQLIVDDIFEKEIIRWNADLTGKVIEAGQTEIIDWLSYEVKLYEDDAVKFYSTAYEDLKFDYRISKIVFTDGSVKK